MRVLGRRSSLILKSGATGIGGIRHSATLAQMNTSRGYRSLLSSLSRKSGQAQSIHHGRLCRDCQSFYDAKNFGAHIDARELTRETLGMMAVLRIFEHLADGALKLMWGGVIRCKVNARARPMDARVRICLVLGKTRSDDWYPETQRLVDAAVARRSSQRHRPLAEAIRTADIEQLGHCQVSARE